MSQVQRIVLVAASIGMALILHASVLDWVWQEEWKSQGPLSALASNIFCLDDGCFSILYDYSIASRQTAMFVGVVAPFLLVVLAVYLAVPLFTKKAEAPRAPEQ